MSANRIRILLVEDEQAITEPLAEALDRDGFTTEVVGSLDAARESIISAEPETLSYSTSDCPMARGWTSAASSGGGSGSDSSGSGSSGSGSAPEPGGD